MLSNGNRSLLRLSIEYFRSRCVNYSSVLESNSSLHEIPQKHEKNEDAGSDKWYETGSIQTRLLKVALLGRPNAGKSTLINRLVSRSVCPVSMKVHTTKQNARAVFTEGNAQVVFIDTPGVLSDAEMRRYKALNNNAIVKAAVKQAHLVGLIQDVSDLYNRNRVQNYVSNMLKEINPVAIPILIFNKVDTLKKKDVLLELVRTFKARKDLVDFADVFMISALEGNGVNDLRDYLIDVAAPGEWEYLADDYTDQNPSLLIKETVRAKLMDALPKELPYLLKPEVMHIEVRADGSMICLADIICPTERITKLMLKAKGVKIKALGRVIEEELRSAFQNSVTVLLNVKTK